MQNDEMVFNGIRYKIGDIVECKSGEYIYGVWQYHDFIEIKTHLDIWELMHYDYLEVIENIKQEDKK